MFINRENSNYFSKKIKQNYFKKNIKIVNKTMKKTFYNICEPNIKEIPKKLHIPNDFDLCDDSEEESYVSQK